MFSCVNNLDFVMNCNQAEKYYKALANRRRLAILQRLLKNESLTVGQLAETINLSLKATSKHMQTLRAAGMVESEQRGLEHYYFLSDRKNVFVRHLLSVL